jgi:hypothetical protein
MTITELHKRSIYRRCQDEFGTVEDALLAAGVYGWPRRYRLRLLSKDETLVALRGAHERGEELTRVALRSRDLHLVRSVDRHFPSWKAALTALRTLMNTGE